MRATAVTDPLITETEAANYLALSPATLRKWRILQQGPAYLKVGRAVRYRRADVEAYLTTVQPLRTVTGAR